MRKYHGTIVHRSKDNCGTIEIIDDGYTRSLYFGNVVRQSAMDLWRPEHLVLNYTRAMMCSLLFGTTPSKVLLIGLGGGSLAKFLLYHFPHCIIDVVECRELVVNLAYQHFLLPNDQRLHIHIADGADFVKHTALFTSKYYDLILVDAYNNQGMDYNMGEHAFINACHTLLSLNGVLAINLWGRDQPRYKQILRELRQCFNVKPLLMPSEGTTNMIAMVSLTNNMKTFFKAVEVRAKLLEQVTGLEFVRLSRILRKHNKSLINFIFQ